MDGDLMITIGATGVGVAVLLAVNASLLLASAVPAERRDYRARPPAFLRLLWPLVRAAGYHATARVPAARLSRLARRLQRAEWDGRVGPADWIGGVVVYAALGAALGTAVALLLGLGAGAAVAGALAGAAVPELQLRDAIARRDAAVRRDLPAYLDVLTLGVEAGCSLPSAIGHATDKAPEGPLRRGFQRLLAEIRAGRPRADALRSFEGYLGLPAITALVGALLQAERTGASLGPVLRAQSDQRTSERFARAEKLAMQAPVKMLGPLILCIFPCTFLVLGFPVALRLTGGF